MKHTARNRKQTRLPARLGVAAAALLCLGLLAAAPAQASFEQVGTFAGSATPVSPPFAEEVQLGGVGGMAVNYTGAGGVPAGTVYAAVSSSSEPPQIGMYEPIEGGGLKFVMAWEATFEERPYKRCGPLLLTQCAPQAGGNPRLVDVDIDQATGNVYAQDESVPTGKFVINEYSPDGSELITRFGKQAPSGSTRAETPDQIHAVSLGGIAVNASGEVFVADRINADNFYHRLMKFVPKAANKFDEYEYAGTAQDVAAGFVGEGRTPTRPMADAAGHLYVVGNENNSVEEYDPTHPADPALCTFEESKGGVAGMTVSPVSGEVFYYGYQKPKQVHRLGPCNEATGKFTELEPAPEAFVAKPQRSDVWALAFDPVRQLDASRAPGVLYGGAPEAITSTSGGGGEPGQSSLGYIFAHSREVAPKVEAQSFAHVGATTALLQATINSESFATHYVFQYLSEAEYEANPPTERFAGAREAPPGGADLPGALGGQPVAAAVSSLLPDTSYRVRTVAISSCSEDEPAKVCEGAGEALLFHTFPAEVASLPDHRAYELVSPAEKHGGQVYPANPRILGCAACSKPGEGDGRFPMQSSADGEAVVYEGDAFGEGVGGPNENEYLARRTGSGWQSTTLTPPLLSSHGGRGGYKQFSTDLSQAVLEQIPPAPALSPEAPGGYANLYAQPSASPLALRPFQLTQPLNRPLNVKYAGASADLSRVFFAANDTLTAAVAGIAPAAPEVGPEEFNLYEWRSASGELALVSVLPGNATASPNASFGVGSAHSVSADGKRVLWSNAAGQVYLREDGEVTREVPDAGKFLAAATDGSQVLLTNGHLYDLETKTTTDLSAGKGGFQGIAGQSDDLSHVYFVDTEVLSGEEENDQKAKAQAGKLNLYAWSEGTTRFVATLSSDDDSIGSHSWSFSPSQRTAQASPQGRYLAFLSLAPLTGYDNTGSASTHCRLVEGGPPPVYGPGPCAEAFVYDSATGKLSCASCNPTGTAPLGGSQLPLIEGPDSLPQAHYLTDQGRLYFDSKDSLSPFDTNEGIQDVYQWEPGAVGSCERQAGCLNLISAGKEPIDSNFLAADPSGKDVFFTTRDQLVLKDKDELLDLYVAREGGGIPAESEVARSECQGEACQPPISPPNDPTPGSSTFEGAGNVGEKKPAKKHKKKKHAKKKHAHKRAAKHNRGGVK